MARKSDLNGDLISSKLNLGPDVKELKLGSSFTNNKGTAFHSIRYDFKPASIDESKVATIEVGESHQVQVTIPHLDGAGVPNTLFKGSQRPYQRECVLILDKTTGEVTLEKLASNIQVKNTRPENSQPRPPPVHPPSAAQQKKIKPQPRQAATKQNVNKPTTTTTGGNANKTKKTSKLRKITSSLSGCIPRHSPLHASPSYPSRSPTRSQHKSPIQNIAVSASLPIIGIDDPADPIPEKYNQTHTSERRESLDFERLLNSEMEASKEELAREAFAREKGTLSESLTDSSSSSSSHSSGSSSSDSSDTEVTENRRAPFSDFTNGHNFKQDHMRSSLASTNVLNEDLQLSESDSHSD